MKLFDEIVGLLKANKNIILTGAPGTGKTYLAKQIAYELTKDTEDNHPHMDFCQFHPSMDYTDFVEGLRPVSDSPTTQNIIFKRQDGIFKKFCKEAKKMSDKQPQNVQTPPDNAQKDDKKDAFDIAWDKFIQEAKEKSGEIGLKTVNRQKPSTITFSKNGVLYIVPKTGHQNGTPIDKESLRNFLFNGTVDKNIKNKSRKPYYRAVKKYFEETYFNKNISNIQNYVFIIDEINRGDIAKIFGELFYSIDPGYRGEKGRVKTQYSNLIEDGDVFKDGFYVPENVYIIGTMNDIDRNVESMDFAIRRRFTWKKILPEDTQKVIFVGLANNIADEAKSRMDALNKAIRAEKTQLGENFCIGASYFEKVDSTPEKWENLWNYRLAPLLEEYVRGLPDSDKILARFENAYKLKGQDNTNVENN